VTRIKVCGNTRAEDVELAIELGVDLLGFIFAPSLRQISIDEGRRLAAGVPDSVERVGVFIDEPAATIAAFVGACRLSAVQLYRSITPEDRRLGVGLIPALRVRDGAVIAANGAEPSDRLLLDTFRADSAGGGTGETWNWEAAATLARRHPVIVSGGLRPDNVAAAIARLDPWGVDVSSGVEAEPRRKDPTRLRAFVSAVRQASPA
jgi:phosphoribosylanthranilate isomerase